MPEVTTCPDCMRMLRVPDNLIGKKVRCPGCTTMFTAAISEQQTEPEAEQEEPAPPPIRRSPTSRPARSEAISPARSAPPPAPAAEEDEDLDERRPRRSRRDEEADEEDRPRSKRQRDDDEEEEDRPRRRRSRYEDDEDDDYGDSRERKRAGWVGARFGINLAILGGWGLLSTIGLAFIAGGITMIMGGSILSSLLGGGGMRPDGMGGLVAMGGVMILMFGVIGLVYLAAEIAQLVGYGMCMQVPARRGSSLKGLAIAAFVCMALAVLLNSAGTFVTYRSYGGGATGSISSLLGGIGFTLWILFLRAVASELRAQDLASTLMTHLISWWVAGFLGVLLVIMTVCVGMGAALNMAGNNPAAAGTSIGATAIIAGILFLILMLGSLGMWIWHLFLLQEVRDVIDRQISRL